MESAQKALRLVEELAGTQRREEAMIAWGLNAFERGAAPAIEWFSSHTDGQDGTAPSAARFALALAEFRNGQLSEGRALVERLAQEWPPDNADGASLRWQSCVLSALSHLAATREWAASGNASVGKQDDSPRELTPFLEELGLAPDAAENVIAKSAADYVKRLRSKHKEAVENLAVKLKKRQITKNECEEKRESLRGDLDHELREFHELRTGAAIHQRHAARAASEVEDLPEEDPPAREREIKAKNRALWAAARDRITPLLDRLGEAPAQWSWWKPFISGLLAYADHNATLGSDEIARFAAAIEHVESPAARTRLREIEASLVSRANAVEQVCSLIREKRHAELREFNESVLIHFVESIPATVRAAVHMTLWNADPDYNPLPQLLRISAEPADAGLIGQCVAEVKTAQAMSQLAQSLRTRSTAALPSFEQLGDADAKVTSPARLAAAVMYLRDDELMAAAGQLSSLPQDSRDPAVVYARFYLSWRQGDGASCVVQLARSDESNLYLGTRHRQAVIAARVFLLIEALKSERFDDALTLLEVGPDQDASRLLATIRNLVPWLMRNGMAPAARKLLAGIRQRIPQQGAEDERYALDWACLAFEPLLTAQLGQYTACVESADRVIRLALPRHPAFGTAQADTQILAWCNLLRIAAELGLAAATSADEIKLLWLSLRRTLEDRTVELSTIEPVRPYALLISGLVAGLSTDMVVDQSTLHGLSSAQRELDLSRHATFLERVIAKSHSRLRAIADFWEALRRGNLNRAREIHRKELVPTFGERVPHAIKLASLVADWGADALTPQELTLRLDQLQYDAPELPAGVVADFRSHIADGEKIREITRLLREQRFDEVVTIINNATWAGIEANAMPVAVAVAKLYALFKTRNVEASTDLASGLSDARGLADWVRDAGALLLGYVWFERREFPQAAAAFQRMSRPTLLGHNMEAYLAAAHFNEGLQLLEVDNKEKAFDAFARSLSVTSRAEKTASLLPLFLHFGLKGLEANSAPRARKAFQLAMRSVAEEGSSAQTSFRGLIAQLGDLLRKALDSEEVDPPDGSDFLDLLEDLGELPSPENISPQVFERTVRILAICQDLRRQAALPTGKRIAEPKLTSFLRTQIAALEKLAPEPKHHDRVVGLAPEPEQRDPVVGVLKGVVDLLMGRNRRNRMAVLDELEAAFRLGVQSQKLADLVRKERDQIKTLLADKTNGLDLLDVYLASGEAPPALVDDWTADAALTELYRLDRGYMPADVSGESKESEFASLLARLNALAEYAEEKFPKLGKDLKETISEVETGGKRLRDLEQKIACELAASLREQRQDGATPAGTS